MLKVFEALYIANDFRLHLFSESSNNALTTYSYYNERQFQNIKHDIRSGTKVLVNETFDAVYSRNSMVFFRYSMVSAIYKMIERSQTLFAIYSSILFN